MKILIVSTVLAMSLGATTLPAGAQGITFGSPNRGDCRMIEKRVVKNNRTVITKERRCDGDRRSSRERNQRYGERRDNGPGIYIGR